MPRRRNPTPREAKAAVLGFANVVAGVLDFLDEVSEGEETVPAAKKAVSRAKARGRALGRAERRTRKARALDDGGEER